MKDSQEEQLQGVQVMQASNYQFHSEELEELVEEAMEHLVLEAKAAEVHLVVEVEEAVVVLPVVAGGA